MTQKDRMFVGQMRYQEVQVITALSVAKAQHLWLNVHVKKACHLSIMLYQELINVASFRAQLHGVR